MEPIIIVENLKKYYKDVKAVNDISFQVDKGELFGFLGINGAGKSTTINMLCTLIPPTDGTVCVCGYELGKEDEEIRKRIGVVYQTNCLDDLLTVKENLIIRGSLYESNKKKLEKNLEEVSGILSLGEILKRPFAKLSGGQKRRCEIARALMHAPEILFLDEPTTGLDPATRKSVWESIDNLRKEKNMTVFLTTHYMEEATKATHIAMLDKGHIMQYGTPFALKNQFAKDLLRLVPKDTELLLHKLTRKGIVFVKKEEFFVVSLDRTLEAIELLEEFKDDISGFEVVQGSMDDVFLNVTGRTLESREVIA